MLTEMLFLLQFLFMCSFFDELCLNLCFWKAFDCGLFTWVFPYVFFYMLYYKIIKRMFSYRPCYRSEGRRTYLMIAVFPRGEAEGQCSHPKANTTARGPVTGVI